MSIITTIISNIQGYPIECLESWFNEKQKLFKVDTKTFKNAKRWLYLNDYSSGLDKYKHINYKIVSKMELSLN